MHTESVRDRELRSAPHVAKSHYAPIADFLFILLKCVCFFSSMIDVGDSGWLILHMQEIRRWKKATLAEMEICYFFQHFHFMVYVWLLIPPSLCSFGFIQFECFFAICVFLFNGFRCMVQSGVAWHVATNIAMNSASIRYAAANSKLFPFQFQSQCIIIHVHGIAILMKWMVISILMSMSKRILWEKLQMQSEKKRQNKNKQPNHHYKHMYMR